ncbi:MAG: hypothetical protein IPL70_18130 [Uliginosibacterium sp.]|nr:hypothetical protein [Uliginosibacterium sp.]
MWVFAGRFAVILLLVGALSSAQAAPGEQRKQDLSVLKDQIRSLQDEIARGEESHDEVADKLSVSDMAVSMARRRLRVKFLPSEVSLSRNWIAWRNNDSILNTPWQEPESRWGCHLQDVC